MSDRRTVLLVVAALSALVGAVLAGAALVALQAPSRRGGDLGEQVDAGGVLTGALVIGLLLAVAGAATAVGLVRAQLPGRDAGGSGSRADGGSGGRIVP